MKKYEIVYVFMTSTYSEVLDSENLQTAIATFAKLFDGSYHEIVGVKLLNHDYD